MQGRKGALVVTYRRDCGRLFLSRFDPEGSSGTFSANPKDALIFSTYEEANYASSFFDKSGIEILAQVIRPIVGVLK